MKIQNPYIKYFLIFKLVVLENINSIFIYHIVTNIYAHKFVEKVINKNQFIPHKSIILRIKPGHIIVSSAISK
jgi:hypothetical protein